MNTCGDFVYPVRGGGGGGGGGGYTLSWGYTPSLTHGPDLVLICGTCQMGDGIAQLLGWNYNYIIALDILIFFLSRF